MRLYLPTIGPNIIKTTPFVTICKPEAAANRSIGTWVGITKLMYTVLTPLANPNAMQTHNIPWYVETAKTPTLEQITNLGKLIFFKILMAHPQTSCPASFSWHLRDQFPLIYNVVVNLGKVETVTGQTTGRWSWVSHKEESLLILTAISNTKLIIYMILGDLSK